MSSEQESIAPASINQGLSPEIIARYLQGAPPESEQYQFFVGDWDCELRAYAGEADAAVTLRAEWRAQWTHERRMLIDDLSVFLPGGEEVVAWVNLRTYSAETGCWEISGHRALSPGSGAITHGHWRNGEMQLDFDVHSSESVTQNAVRFYAITPESFEWEWQQRASSSPDWSLFASISARRMPSQ